jgi:hypothetical protein
MNFISTFSQRERYTLRRVVKIVHMKHHPKNISEEQDR